MISALYAKNETDKVVENLNNSKLEYIFDSIQRRIKEGAYYFITRDYLSDGMTNKLKALGYKIIQNKGLTRIDWKDVEEKS